MGVATAISIWLFANQYPKYVAPIPTHHPALSDLTFEVGFVMAAILYALLFPIFKQPDPAPPVPAAPGSPSFSNPGDGGP
jgi:NCS1 family nucleobase:cation symporter-1